MLAFYSHSADTILRYNGILLAPIIQFHARIHVIALYSQFASTALLSDGFLLASIC